MDLKLIALMLFLMASWLLFLEDIENETNSRKRVKPNLQNQEKVLSIPANERGLVPTNDVSMTSFSNRIGNGKKLIVVNQAFVEVKLLGLVLDGLNISTTTESTYSIYPPQGMAINVTKVAIISENAVLRMMEAIIDDLKNRRMRLMVLLTTKHPIIKKAVKKMEPDYVLTQ